MNSVGMSSLSNDSGWVSVRFRATINTSNKFAPPKPTGTVPQTLSTVYMNPTKVTVENGTISGAASG